MERLTMRNSDGSYSQPTHTTFEARFYRLAEVEDFLEDTVISDFAELKRILTTNAVWQENQTLKGNWAKLKEYLEETYEYFIQYENMEDCASGYKNSLDKMRELEGGDGRKR